MQISYLCDQPQFVDTLASLLLEQWRFILADETVHLRIAKLRQHLNRDELPIAWVAHAEDEVLGTASLRVHDLEGREDLTPWLGGAYVVPQWRHRGIGEALCGVVEKKAQQLAAETLYLFTLDKQHWYARQGWQLLAPCCWRGHAGNIMQKEVGRPNSRIRDLPPEKR